jgi:hypothetical protein
MDKALWENLNVKSSQEFYENVNLRAPKVARK